MKNPRRIFLLLRYSLRVFYVLLFFAVSITCVNTWIISRFGALATAWGVFGSWGLTLVALCFVAGFHDVWLKTVQKRQGLSKNFPFLVEAHIDRLIPHLHSSAYDGAPVPFDEKRMLIGSTLRHILWKLDTESIQQMSLADRNALVFLLKSEDVRVVQRTLELIEQATLLEAMPMVRRLVDGKLRTSGDIYNTPIAERVLRHLEAQLEIENAMKKEQQYVRASFAPKSELLHPAMDTVQEDNLLRPM